MPMPPPPGGQADSPSHDQPGLAMLDLPRLRGICPDAAQLNRLLILAREHLHSDLVRMRAALERGDAVAAAERVHHIKGAACMLCRAGDGLLGQLDAARAAMLGCVTMPVIADEVKLMEDGLLKLDLQLLAALHGPAA
ncbi:Uncharacterised protein [Bordetella ansorpii]|uniref:HPt domain-containing protein n=1 Tax=Bordetella ansorpii TaxID=288768 RepID=A0A157RFE8_9BORD|nr:hypothetical protein [Bordetella ansorpii]SAI56688.1 Uncharacterised protein [Bordetella ansorpii]